MTRAKILPGVAGRCWRRAWLRVPGGIQGGPGSASARRARGYGHGVAAACRCRRRRSAQAHRFYPALLALLACPSGLCRIDRSLMTTTSSLASSTDAAFTTAPRVSSRSRRGLAAGTGGRGWRRPQAGDGGGHAVDVEAVEIAQDLAQLLPPREMERLMGRRAGHGLPISRPRAHGACAVVVGEHFRSVGGVFDGPIARFGGCRRPTTSNTTICT